ncbi:threonine/serine exporter family protein [Rhodopirellula halodulae]|uniref:threonine/serine ThrE exporter family protein n=1 Tax=Rhodopirellula halodulae TaxID=2894198 RepID=UPI001E3F6FAB|nr:threonine/serine exporter family protein [Rhodopirellula sp. JC737]MCC9656216.1 threonine/serine exporter family protein [Rhodopirellula sp. JC737]
MNSDVSSKQLVLELARSLHACGSPAYELDLEMEQVSASLGHEASFFSTPTALFVTFGGDDTRLIRVYPSDTNLGRYAALFELQREIQENQLNTPAAWQRLSEINAMSEGYGTVTQILSHGGVAACISVLVGGDIRTTLSAGVVGLMVGILVTWLTAQRHQVHLINVAAGFLASSVACSIQAYFGTGNFEITSLAALILLVPGLHLTISINELATQNLASGSARFSGAMTTLLTIVFGVSMGYGLVDALIPIPPSVQLDSPDWFASSLVLVPIGLCVAVTFRTRYRDIPWLLASTLLGYGVLRLAGTVFGPFASVGIAAFVTGVTSHHASARLGLPTAVMLLPALLLLVPGSLGFSGLSQIMLKEDLPSGIHLTATMMLTAVSIVAGLLLTDVVVSRSDKQSLESPTTNTSESSD